MMVVVGACGAPAIDASIDTDNVKLPDRTVIVAGDAGPSTDKDSGGGGGPDELSLTVTLAGPGTGTITSTPSGVVCVGTTCKGSFPRGTTVTLAAAPTTGALFGGWSGGCTVLTPSPGAVSCVAKLDVAVAATASFESVDGSWSGTYTNTRLAAGCQFSNKGNLTVAVKTTGTTFSSSATVTGLELRQIPSCSLVSLTTGAAPDAALAIAADALTGTWTFTVAGANGTLAFPFTAKLAGKTMTGSWTCPTCTGSFTLTKP